MVGLAVAVVLLMSLLFHAPARLVSYLVSPDALVLQAFRGSVWDGRANRALLRTDAGYLHLGSIQWELRPWSLLTLSPRLEFTSDWAGQRVSSTVVLRSEHSFDFRDLQLNAPADLVRHVLPLALGGLIEAQFEELKVRDGLPVAARGRLVWRDSSWRAPQGPLRLGTYGLDIETDDTETLRGEIVTLSGAVQATGQVSLAGAAYTADVRLSAENEMPSALQQALSLVARPEDGGYRLVLEGSLVNP